MKSSIQDKAEGKWLTSKGKIKQIAENIVGNIQKKVGEIKDVIGK